MWFRFAERTWLNGAPPNISISSTSISGEQNKNPRQFCKFIPEKKIIWNDAFIMAVQQQETHPKKKMGTDLNIHGFVTTFYEHCCRNPI